MHKFLVVSALALGCLSSIASGHTAETRCADILASGGLDFERYADQLRGIMSRSARVERAFLHGHSTVPKGAKARAVAIAEFLGRSDGDLGSLEFVGVTPKGKASHRNTAYPFIRVEDDADLNTLRSYYEDGEIPDGIEVMAVGLHGVTMSYSHMGSLYYLMDLLGQLRTGQPRSYFAKDLSQHLAQRNLSTKVGMMSFDLIGHGAGPSVVEYGDLDKTIEFLRQVFVGLRARLDAKGLKHVPIVVLARSGTPMLIGELVKRYPGLIQKVTGVSETLPEVGFPEGFGGVLAELAETAGGGQLNLLALDWFLRIRKQVSYHHDENPFRGIPRFAVTGSLDLQTPASVREWLASQPGLTYRDYSGVGHDVYRIPKDPQFVMGRMTEPVYVGGWLRGRREREYVQAVTGMDDIRRALGTYTDLFEFWTAP